MLATAELLQEAAQPQSLAETLRRAADQVPLYRKSFAASLGIQSDLKSADLSRFSFVTKADIRRGFPANFLGPDADLDNLLEREDLEVEHTSGTSEERTPLLLPRGWWAEQELRALELNEVVAAVLRQNPSARRATINSPSCSNDIRYHGVPPRCDRIVDNALFASLSRYPFLWSQHDLERMANEIVEWQPEFLDVDPVYGVVFALYCEKQRIRLPSVRFIICSYEFVSTVHRRILQRVFQVPVYDLYGSTETGHLLMEDVSGEMRPSLQTAYLELLEVDAQGIGQLIVTTLTNPLMPLIRYNIGDLAQRADTPYGKRYVLHGRLVDSFQVAPHQRVTTRQIDECFGDIKGIAHYQLIQKAPRSWCLRFVPEASGPDPVQLTALKARLRGVLQDPDSFTVQSTDMLLPERSGKFRLGYPLVG